MTRAEIIATTERVARENGWHFDTANQFAPRVVMRPGARASATIGLPFVHLPLEVRPVIDAVGERSCTQAVADWPEVQRMVAALKAALEVKP